MRYESHLRSTHDTDSAVHSWIESDAISRHQHEKYNVFRRSGATVRPSRPNHTLTRMQLPRSIQTDLFYARHASEEWYLRLNCD